MHKITITQQDGWQTMTTMCMKHGAVISTRTQVYKMPTPKKKPTKEAIAQARARYRQLMQERNWDGT